MTARDLEAINADITIAKTLMYNQNLSRNPYIINQIAYHSCQAIEKSLKAIIRNEGKMTTGLSRSHSISGLMLGCETCRQGIIHEYPFITKNAEVLTKFNSLRYAERGVNKADAFALFKEAQKLHRNLEKEYLKDDLSKRKMREISLKEYNGLEKYSLDKSCLS